MNNGNDMNSPGIWEKVLPLLLIACTFALISIMAIVVEHWLKKRKYDAESENVELKNKIVKDITYHQLKEESQRKHTSGNLQILQQILDLEGRIQNNENLESRKKQLQALESLKKSFKENIDKKKEDEEEEEDEE